jgi:hypothetical protein
VSFKKPETAEEAETIRDQLKAELVRLQTALGDRNRTKNGRRLSEHEYWTWRQKTAEAMAGVVNDLRAVKKCIKDFNTRRPAEALADGYGEGILQTARMATCDLWDYVKLLESRNRALELENEELRSIRF